jgi:single-stranded-DNA-specific exonuclease
MRWIEPEEHNLTEDYLAAVGGSLLVARALFRRGLTSPAAVQAFIDPAYYMPVSPLEMPGMEHAVERIERAILNREIICVWGDFDVDGQTATTVLVSTLRELGAQVIYHIPVRAKESHGVNLPVLEKILNQSVHLVLTCDTGITAHQAVDFTQERGIDFIVTDHHELPPALPRAYAIVNPRLLPEGHALSTLPGVGVAYKLAEQLFINFGKPEKCAALLDLVALGIVADVARQTGETRYLLQRGLEILRSSPRLGLQMIMELADLNPAHLSEEHIGFILGPRLNALGRLGDANPVVELLTTSDDNRARTLAYQLEGLNSRRQLLTSQVYKGALAQIEQEPALLNDPVLVLAHPAWPAGVIGIVASRLVERFSKPVIMVATPEGQVGRGSARSVEGVDITAAIAGQAELLEGFGGHAMAAGFGIQPANIPAFRRGLGRALRNIELPPEASLSIEGYLNLDELTLDFVADLERLAPFGPGNPPLVLATRNVRLLSQSTLGRNQEHSMLIVEDERGVTRRVIWWQSGDELNNNPLPDSPFDMAYTVRASTFRGQRDVQVTWIDYRLRAEQAALKRERKIGIQDFRQELHPIPVLERLLAEADLQVWVEAEAVQKLEIRLESGKAVLRNRQTLSLCSTLVIWTTPPGRAEFNHALEACQPRQLVLFGVDPGCDALEALLTRLVGMVKYALRSNDGWVDLEKLASAMAHRRATVRAGLEWIAASRYISILEDRGEMLRVEQGKNKSLASGVLSTTTERDDQGDRNLAFVQLQALLEETSAFRDYFRRADPCSLVATFPV